MRVFRDLKQLPSFRNSVITIGTFDGVHLGHQKLIDRIKTLAKQQDGERIIITFHPHPRLVINPEDNSLRLLNTIEEKIALLEKYGVDNLVIVPFSRDFSEQNAEEYVQDFLFKNFNPKFIVIGYDHKFGKNRIGDYLLLEKLSKTYGYQLEEITKEMLEDMTISSTKIREALNRGEVKDAHSLLGHYHTLTGLVVKGLQNGRKLGYPTANIQINDPHKLIPKTGIYAVLVNYANNYYKGMLSIGYNPTFGGKFQSVEVNILDFDKEIYGEIIKLEFVAYVRDEKKFESMEALIKAIDNDKIVIEKILAKI